MHTFEAAGTVRIAVHVVSVAVSPVSTSTQAGDETKTVFGISSNVPVKPSWDDPH